jgi:TonB-dependent receptor
MLCATFRRTLQGTVLLGLCVTNAQTAEVSDEAAIEEIVVTGIRLQNQRAVDVRRQADKVVDAVTSDDVGRLPDFNMGEALQRLPGVAVQNDQAEARFVTVRGLNAAYNYTTVDGASIAVPDRNGRRVFMDVMPASLADRIDVFKTFTPDLEGSAIGGVLDIRTASAFDRGRHQLNLSSEVGRYSNREGYNSDGLSGDADLTYSTTFGAAEQFGIVVFGNYYKRNSYVPQFEAGGTHYFYDANGVSAGQPGVNTGVYPGTGFAVPGERRWYWYHNDRERHGGGLKLEFRPDDAHYVFFRGFWNQATDDEDRQTDLLTHSGGGALSNQTPTSGELRGASGLSVQENLGQFAFDRQVWAGTAGGEHSLFGGDVSWRLNYSGSRFRNPENWSEWRLNGAAANFAYERTGTTYAFTPLNPAAFNDYATYAPFRRQFDDRGLDEDLYETKVSFAHSLAANWSYEVGLSGRRDERVFDENRERYLPNPGNTFNLAAAGVLRTDQCLAPPGALPGQCMVVVDPRGATQAFIDHFAANPAQWRLDTMTTEDNNLDYTLDETVLAAYGLVRYRGDALNLTIGVRYEDTSTDATGRRLQGSAWTDVSNSGGYDDLLPSLNASYDLSQTVKLRAAYSKSIGRAPFNAIAPVGERLDVTVSPVTLARANPDLEPREADNADFAVDWYLNQGQGVLSLGVFYKRVKNEFFTSVSSQVIDLDGAQVTADVTQLVNAGVPIDIYGVELNVVKNFDFLPAPFDGLGIQANATVLDTNFKQRMNDGTFVDLETMVGQADETYNAALFYDKGPISMRLAYNYTGLKLTERVNTVTAYRNRYDGAEESLDFKATYRINEQWGLTVNGWNITDEGRTEYMGWRQELPMVVAETGSAWFGGFTFAF